MTLTNAIKKATKLIGTEPRIEGQFYKFIYNGYELSFSRNGREDEATCFYTRRVDMHDDITTDYFAGFFHDNLTQAFNFIKNR